ncbi:MULTISPECIES: hypothetical protein [Luteibacter]|uniref:hypothetical protein n=1 Tax=Luteibacter TaxID=242605 RepID=UPI0005678630|nr:MULTISPECIES: hypothetical protein [unclassified Luteibacter]
MTTQLHRHANLRTILTELEREGYTTREAQALYLGRVVTPARLDSMLAGADIPTLVAAHIEHVLFKPRGWMSESHAKLSAPREFHACSDE